MDTETPTKPDRARDVRWPGQRRPQAANLSQPELQRRQEAARAARQAAADRLATMVARATTIASAIVKACTDARVALEALPVDVPGVEAIAHRLDDDLREVRHAYLRLWPEAYKCDRASAKLPAPRRIAMR